MRALPIRSCGCALLAGLLTACGSHRLQDEQSSPPAGATVVAAEELTTSSILLEALAQRVKSMHVARSGSGCPVVMVRGQAIGRNTGSATVYVDGTRMLDTCILQELAVADVERVELYPVAGGRAGGYLAGPGGLIVVHRRK